MTRRGVLSLACKVLGIVFFAEALISVPQVIQFSMISVHTPDVSGADP